MIFPQSLQSGSCIGLTCPAGGFKNLSLIQKTKKYLYDKGYKVITPDTLKRKIKKLQHPELSYLAAEDTARAHDFEKLLISDKADAVWCLRGGFGSQLILDHLNFPALKKNINKLIKPVIGFSDITILLLAMYSRLGLMTIHGPMPIVWFKTNKELTLKEKISAKKLWELLYSKKKEFSYTSCTKIIQKGKGQKTKGILLGGNLTAINSMPEKYLPDFKNTILFLEDINEAPYSIHRELINMGQRGILNQVKGIIFCNFGLKSKQEHNELQFIIKKILKDFKIKKSIPVVYGFPIGHGRLNLAVPVGRQVTMEVYKKENKVKLYSS